MNKAFSFNYLLLLLCVCLLQSCTIFNQNSPYFKSHLEEIVISNTDSIIYLKKGKVLITKEEGESGDYINYHLQFYKNNELKYYKRISKFFNSLCYNGVIVESEEYSFVGANKKLERRTVKDENGNKINPAECQFPYRFPFEFTYILNE